MQTGLLVSISSALLVSALSSTSYAQNTQRSVSVIGVPVADSISYSEPAQNKKPALESVITYLVTITSENGNTYNQVRYEPTFYALSGSIRLRLPRSSSQIRVHRASWTPRRFRAWPATSASCRPKRPARRSPSSSNRRRDRLAGRTGLST